MTSTWGAYDLFPLLCPWQALLINHHSPFMKLSFRTIVNPALQSVRCETKTISIPFCIHKFTIRRQWAKQVREGLLVDYPGSFNI